jgi:hypothetical protein
MDELIKDDMIFKPYLTMGGWQCIMHTGKGKISVRHGGHGLMTNQSEPYEVWYPNDDTPTGYQTADDIWEFIGG